MRIPNLLRSQDSDLDSMMTPMIDVVFLLLVFFVWTTSTQVIEYVLPSQVSEKLGNQQTDISDLPPPEEDFDDVVIKIGWNGTRPTWHVNDVRIGSISSLDQQLRAIAQIKVDAPIVLSPESLVPIGFVIEAFDLAKLAGFQQVSLAVKREAVR